MQYSLDKKMKNEKNEFDFKKLKCFRKYVVDQYIFNLLTQCKRKMVKCNVFRDIKHDLNECYVRTATAWKSSFC